MQTKLSVFCDRLMEAGWLMAAMLAPLYFDVYSNRVFEPDKIALVRSIATIMAATWIIKLVDTGMLSSRRAVSANGQPPLPIYQRITQNNPLAIPALILVAVYLIATVTSVAPMITLWGSYQRLQGTYSTLSYIVIFFLAAATIHTREQIERVISVVILTSIPTALYGIVEHLKLEWLPWGGDVTVRVTSTMGNPIFIAAYLIMAVPLTLGRFSDRLNNFLAITPTNNRNGKGNGVSSSRAVLVFITLLQAVAWYLVIHFGLRAYGDMILKQPSGIGLIIFLVALILAIALPFIVRRGLSVCFSASFYGAVLLVQLATIWYSQSRGPQLGLAAGLVVFIFLYAMKRNSRALWYSGLGVALAAALVLAVVQVPNSPLSFLHPYLGRLSSIVDQGSSTVRSLIWQGARQLIGIHDPIAVPGVYTDQFNALRPLIGYGPDAMYVAYNRFYPPDLAHHEARNASPDRSHNETFDALVTTGILGYFAYWIVFYTVIYMALRFLKVIDERHGRYLFAALLLAGVAALVIIYGNLLPIEFTPGPPLLGVAVLGGYLILSGVLTYDWKGNERAFDLILIALVSAVVAHFVEIQFGIAIAATRVHFWLFAALIVVAGRLAQAQEAEPVAESMVVAAPQERVLAAAAPRQQAGAASFSKKKGKVVATGRQRQDMRTPPSRQHINRGGEADLWTLIQRVLPATLPLAVVGGIILTTMANDFILPPNTQNRPPATTSVQVWLYFLTLVACAIVVALDRKHDPRSDEVNERVASLIIFVGVSLLMWIAYIALRGSALATVGSQVDQVPLILVAVYYLTVSLFGLALAGALYLQHRPAVVATPGRLATGIAYAVVAVAVLFFVIATNVNIVLADVQYKTGLAYDNLQRYDASIQSYQQAIALEPGQDFYYLFLGRSFMELARQFPTRQANPAYDPNVESPLTLTRERLGSLGREDLIRASLVVLEKARNLNPLNTDHYANLARLYRFWGETSGDKSKLDTADQYFRQATTLSPNNAQLWNEWAIVEVLRGRYDDATAKLQHSLELDDRYDLTYYYLGNLLMNEGESNQDAGQKLDQLTRSAEAYSKCLNITPTYWECAKARGYLYGKYLGRPQDAIADFKLVANALPRPEDLNRISDPNQKQQATQELINVYQNMAITYGQLGQFDQAVANAQVAAALAPNDQGLKSLVEQLKQQQNK